MFNSIHPIPAFLDNYIWAITDQQNTELAVVDPGDPAPVIQYAEQHGLTLSHILITHHHKDHTGGLPELQRYSQPRVIGPCSTQIQGITEPVADADTFELFTSSFTTSKDTIPINGLVWMGAIDFMKTQIREKIAQGYGCLKLKIGALEFSNELALLKEIRNEFSVDQMIIRVDANGGFSPHDVMDKLEALADLEIHSIEQPIKVNQHYVLSEICSKTPIPIALDEELIGVFDKKDREALLDTINPQFIVLKPSLLGGFSSSQQWIQLASERSIGWWVTSALESNIGLNAIAQWTYQLGVSSYQGLGTGSLFSNNIDSPLEVKQGRLTFNLNSEWNTKF